MLILLSPAKNLDFDPPRNAPEMTSPRLASDTATLSRTTRALSRRKIKDAMHLSDDLAALTWQRFQAFDPSPEAPGTKHAILAFNGDVYRGLDAGSLSTEELDWTQSHVRVLSGLYGLLRPYDAILPYRLEMGTSVKTRRGETLYDFWGDRIARAINTDLTDQSAPVVINLASKEYFSAVDRKALKARVITPEFKELKDGQARTLGFFAKTARGLMTRYAAQNRIRDPEALKAFDLAGYRHDAASSTPDRWVFSRPQP